MSRVDEHEPHHVGRVHMSERAGVAVKTIVTDLMDLEFTEEYDAILAHGLPAWMKREDWQTLFARPVIAPISFANGVLFTTTGQTAVALDAATGAVLFAFPTRAECVGGVAITDGGIFFGDLAGNLYRLVPVDPPPRKRSVSVR